VARHNDLIERGLAVYPKTAATYARSGVFILVMGACFSLLGVVPILGGNKSLPNYIFATMGVLFICWGILQFRAAKKWRNK
jgi:hypothetical protein